MKNTVNILVLCTYIFLFAPLESSAGPKEIRVGVYDNKPLIFMAEYGPQGIYIDVLENVAKTEGWNLQYRQGTWDEVFTLLTRNEIDILPVVAFTESRLTQLDFGEQTLISNWGQVYARKNLSMESIQNLEGKKIATLSQDTHGEYFKTLMAQLGIPYETVLIENYAELFQALESGKTDAGVVNYIAARNYAENYNLQSTPIVFNPIQIRYAVPKGDPAGLLTAMDRHITNFKADKNSVYHTSMTHWFGAESPSFQFPGWIKWVFIILSGAFIVLVTGNIILRVQVKAKTKALRIELKNRELAEKAVKKSENMGRKMVANIADVIVIIDQNGINKYKSPNIEKLFGWKPQDVVNASTWDNVHPDDLETTQRFFKQLMQTPDVPGMIKCRYKCKNGSYKWIEFTGINLSHDPDIQGLLGNYHDITERKQSEKLLAESEARFKALHNASFGGILIHDHGIILECNQGLSEMTGYEFSELIGMNGLLLIAERSREAVMNNIRTGYEKPYEAFGLRKNGEEFPIQLEARNIPYKGKQVRTVEFRDITERKKAENVLRENEELLARSQELAHIGSWKLDLINNRLTWSDELYRIFGCDPQEFAATYEAFLDAVHTDDREMVNNAYYNSIREGLNEYEIQHRIVHRSTGEIRIVHERCIHERDEAGTIFRSVGMTQDITELKQADTEREKLQEQLGQAQKLESVGRLAGGVAHDFNNMLGVILGHLEFALEKVEEDNSLNEDLKEIQKAAQRSATLTKQLLTFARKQVISPIRLDVNDTVESMLNMLRRLIGENIDLVWKPAANIWPVKMDPSQIDQILVNLCVNARDAIDGVGKLTIETGRKSFDEQYCRLHPGFKSGDFVLLTVIDNGCGMDKKTLNNLFEPFFTTKEVGKGTGLGLSTVYGIVKQNSGFINVYSEPGMGSTFKFYLPRLVVTENNIKADSEKKATAEGTETILLVEDEPAILRMTHMMLEKKGYSVLSAGTPATAVEKANNHSGSIELLMTDVVMPEMNGRDLAAKVTERFPDIKLLFMSGYTADVIAHQGVLDDGVAFIQKPFSLADMTEKVREVLDMASDKR